MSRLLRSCLIALGVILFSFLSLSCWYWLQFRQPPTEQLRALKRLVPVVEPLLDQHEDSKIASLLDKVPFTVILTAPGRQVLNSNLGSSLRQRQEQGQTVLKQIADSNMIVSETGFIQLYYQLPPNWLDPHLLFPLMFSLLLGLLFVLWDFLSRIHQVDQTDALIMFSQMPGLQHHPEPVESSALEHRVQELEQKNRSLQTALQQAKQWVLAAPTDDVKQLQQQLSRAEQQLDAQNHRLHQAQQAEKKLKEHQQELETQLRQAREQAAGYEDETRASRQKFEAQEAEITRLHQDLQRQLKDRELNQQRLAELEAQSLQLHEAWQEISNLRSTQTELLQREEAWKKEKQRVLTLMHEKEEQLESLRERLKVSRQKIHELSVAYKKQLEMTTHLPEDLSDATRVMESLLDEKDLIEHENAQLQMELADRSSEVFRLRKELEVRAARLQEAQKLIEELAQNLQKNERELSLLGETLEDKLQDLEKLKDLHDEDQQVLEMTLQERDQLREKLSELRSEVESLREEKAHLLYAKDQLEQKLENIDLAAYQFEIDQLRQAMQLMTQQQQRRGQSLEELKAKLKEGEALYQRLKRHAETQEKEIRNLQQEIGVHHSEIGLLREKLSRYEQNEFGFVRDESLRF